MLKAGLLKEEAGDEPAGSFRNQPVVASQQPLYEGPMPTPRQKPFQSASTPVHLTHRFMVSLGLRCFVCF